MARIIISGAEHKGMLKPEMSIVEVSGGRTGPALAFLCTIKGYKFEAITSPIFTADELKTMRAHGA